jgi:CRISP-associated protein Cas1
MIAPKSGNLNQLPGEAEIDYLPALMLNEFVYCPRLFWLEHVDGLFAESADTIEGSLRHRRVDSGTSELAKVDESPIERTHARSVPLASDRYGVVAKLDLIEAEGDIATPIDYKRGSPRKLDDGSVTAWDPDRVQICAQALALRDNGYRCERGFIWFHTTRQRVEIVIDDALVELTSRAIADARRLMRAGGISAS